MKFYAKVLFGVLLFSIVTSEFLNSDEETRQNILSNFLNESSNDLFQTFHFLFKKEYKLESEEGMKRFKIFTRNLEIFKINKANNPSLKFETSLDEESFSNFFSYDELRMPVSVNVDQFNYQDSSGFGSIRMWGRCITASNNQVSLKSCDGSSSQDFQKVDISWNGNRFLHSSGLYLAVDTSSNQFILSTRDSNTIQGKYSNDYELSYNGGCVVVRTDNFSLFAAPNCSSIHLSKYFRWSYTYPSGYGALKVLNKCVTSNTQTMTVSLTDCDGSDAQAFRFQKASNSRINIIDYYGNYLTMTAYNSNSNSNLLLENSSTTNNYRGFVLTIGDGYNGAQILIADSSFSNFFCLDSTNFPSHKKRNCSNKQGFYNQKFFFTACWTGFPC
jgi:hypothetical protein